MRILQTQTNCWVAPNITTVSLFKMRNKKFPWMTGIFLCNVSIGELLEHTAREMLIMELNVGGGPTVIHQISIFVF